MDYVIIITIKRQENHANRGDTVQIRSNSGKDRKNILSSGLPKAIYYQEKIYQPFFSRYTHYKQSWRTKQDLHYHNYPECGRCLKGDGIFFVEDRVYPFTAGTVIFFPAGMHHIAQSPVERNSLWEYIWLDDEALGLELPAREVIVPDRDCNELFRMMSEEIPKGNAGNITLYRHLCAAFFDKLNVFTRSDISADEKARQSILPAIHAIATRYQEPLTAPQLAEICRLSESTLRRNFLTVTGQSPMAYTASIRLMMAEQLLTETDLTVLDISERCGFPCLSTFNRQFLRRRGISPRDFRKEKLL